MQETRVWFLGQDDPLQKELATYSSILAWGVPWTEDPGGLQSMELQRSDTTLWLNQPTTNQREKNIFKTFRFILEYSQLMFDSFVWTSKRLSHRHACIHSPPASPPIQTATSYWEEFPVLYSKMEINCKSSLQRTKFLENSETSFFRGRMLSEVSLWAEDKVGDLAVVERRNQVIIGGVA